MISNDGNISFVTSHTSKHIHNAQLNLNSILDVQHNNLVNLGAFCSTKTKTLINQDASPALPPGCKTKIIPRGLSQ